MTSMTTRSPRVRRAGALAVVPHKQPRAGLRGARTWRRSPRGSSLLRSRLTPRLSPRLTPRGLWAVAALLLLAAVAVAATLGRGAWRANQLTQARAEALAAGRQLAVNFVTMRADTFDADTARVLAGSTGEFRKEYSSTLAKLKPVVVSNRTVSTVERAEASLVRGDTDSAEVIVGVVAPTTNTGTPKAEKKTYRLRLDLVKVGAAWKVGNLELVS